MKKWIFITIIFIAAFFRFYQITIVPPHPSLDEVSIGYNAFSILKTGVDEYGTKFPILLRAYDDWRPALYIYLVVPFVKLFGLSIFAVRLPSVIMSILDIVGIFYIARELLVYLKKDKDKLFSFFPYVAAFLLVVSPWHIYISRLGHEANLALFCFIFGVLFFFRFLNTSRNLFFYLFILFFSFSFDSYQSTKIVIPLFSIFLTAIFIKKIWLKKKMFIFGFLIGLVVILPIIIESISPQGLVRFKATNIFQANPQIVAESSRLILNDRTNNDKISELLHNRRVGYSVLFVQAFASHLNPFWLFSNKDYEPFKSPGLGLFYVFEIIFLISGLFYSIFYLPKKFLFLFLGWVIIAILPGAITTGYPHAMRIYELLPLPQLIEAFGIIFLLSLIFSKTKINSKYIILPTFFLIGIVSIAQFSYSYFFLLPTKISNQFQYGAIQAFEIVKEREAKYDKIIVSNSGNLFESYMFYLFYNKFDPFVYKNLGGTKSGGFAESHKIGKYIFEKIELSKKIPKTLYLLSSNEVVLNMHVIKIISFLDGSPAVIIAD